MNESSYIFCSICFYQGCFNTLFNIHLQYRCLSGTETVLSLSFALGVRQNEGKTSQAAPSPTVLDVAKMYISHNSSLRIPTCGSILMKTSSLEETQSSHLIPLQFRIRQASITDCSYWLLVVIPKSLNETNLNKKLELTLFNMYYYYFVLQTCFKMEILLKIYLQIYDSSALCFL